MKPSAVRQTSCDTASIKGSRMGLFSKLIGDKSTPTDKPVEHAVIVNFQYGGSTDLQPIFALEHRLEATINTAEAGEYDGNEIAADGSEGSLYMYGADADRLLDAVKPVLAECSFLRGARVKVRYGPPEEDVTKKIIVLGE